MLLVGTLLCLETYGQEFKNGTCSGGFWALKEGYGAGYGEWNFPLRNDSDGFLLRDAINIGGFGGNLEENKGVGGCILGNKFMIGGTYNASEFVVRSYGFVSAGFGIFGAEGHKVFNAPFMISSIIGGGFEFQYSSDNSFVVEFGGDMDFLVGSGRKEYSQLSRSCPILMLGFRSYH